MPQKILGIDLGSWSVKAVLLESSFRGSKVEAAGEQPVEPGTPETRRNRQLVALARLMERDVFRADVIVAGFPGELVTTRFITQPFGDEKKIDQTIAGELADELPFELDRAVFSHETIARSKTESTSLCAAGYSDHVRSFLEAVQANGVDPKFVPVDVLELYNLYTHYLREDASKPEAPGSPSEEASTFIAPSPVGPPDARLLVDIGHERTLVAACSEQGIAFVRVLRAGGQDVTEAIAKDYELTPGNAEAGKHEDALVTSPRHPATSDAEQRMADVVTKGLANLVRELRRTIQTIRKEKKVRVARIDLLGGGSRIKNLPSYLAEQLNVPVAAATAVENAIESHTEPHRRPSFAVALASALRATGESPVSQIDMRVGELQYAGQLQHLRRRAPMIGAAAAALAVLLFANVVVQYQVIGAREREIDRQFCDITKKVVGREICEPTVAISVIKQPASELGNFKLPDKSAFRVAAELSHLVPKDLSILVTEIEVTPDKARIDGEVASFDAVDQLVTAYSADKCYSDIKKGRLRKKGEGEGVEFQLSIRLECSK
jgi:type IV pilus assembly protein PilM